MTKLDLLMTEYDIPNEAVAGLEEVRVGAGTVNNWREANTRPNVIQAIAIARYLTGKIGVSLSVEEIFGTYSEPSESTKLAQAA